MVSRQHVLLVVIFTAIFGFTYTEAQTPPSAGPSQAVAEVLASIAPPQADEAVGGSAVEVPLSGPSITSGATVVSAAASDAASAPASAVSSEAPSAAASAPSSDIGKLAADAVKDTQTAVVSGNKLATWLIASSSILWLAIAVLRRRGLLCSRRSVAVSALLASVVGVVGAQMAAGSSPLDAGIFALTGPCAIALNEFLRAFGFNLSHAPAVAASETPAAPSDQA
jgi:hypothetical protein